MFKVKSKGDFSKTLGFLSGLSKRSLTRTETKIIEQHADELIQALQDATPKDTGKTSRSWEYEIDTSNDDVVLRIYNTNYNNGVSIALLLQYGHGTVSGSYVPGIDYINPALEPIFNEIESDFWREVTNG